MRLAIQQPLNMTQVVSVGFAMALLLLFQPIPTVSAQQLTGPVEKKDAQTSTRKSHRLIRKPQNPPVASVKPSPSSSSSVSSLPSPPPTLEDNNMTFQSKESSSLNRSIGTAVPLATMSVAPSLARATGSIAAGTAPTRTIPLAAAGAGNSSTSGSGSAGGRSMSRLAAEMPGLAQLISPPAAVPEISVNPTIGASPTSFAFTAQAGINPATQTLSISNTGGGTLNWSASDSAPWLTLSQASGTGNAAVTLTVATGALTPATYSGTITLTTAGTANVTLPVTFIVTAATSLTVAPASLTYTATQGSTNPASQTITVTSNTAWAVSKSASWLTVSPLSGSNNGAITVSVNTATALVGANTGTITVTGGGITRTVTVTLTLAAAPTVTLNVNQTNLAFTATQGAANPANQSLVITSSTAWTVSKNAGWLTVTPPSGSNNGNLIVSVNTATAVVGANTDTITVTGGGITRTVTITLTVAAADRKSVV